MEYISFRRARDFQNMMLPGELIVEWEHGVIPGRESLTADDFTVEFAKNDRIMKDWLESKAELAVAVAEAARWAEVVSKQDRRLFEEWKSKRGRK